MQWTFRLGAALVALLISTAATAQEIQSYFPDIAANLAPVSAAPAEFVAPWFPGLEAESISGELAWDNAPAGALPALGPTPINQVRPLANAFGLGPFLSDAGIELFGWLEAGYTGVSGSGGLLSVQPRLNRFGDEFVLSDMGFVLQKPLDQHKFDIGFKVRYFAGANPALGQPLGGLDDPPGNPRFSHDFRDLYLQAHLPILAKGGLNVRVGRTNTVIGNNGFIATARPLFSNDYQFFYSTTGTFTACLTQLVISQRLDVWNGIGLGANTFFAMRSENSYCYIGKVNYWLQQEKRTRLSLSLNCGPDTLPAARGLKGDFATIVEVSLVQNWNESFSQVIQSMVGTDENTPLGTGSWYGLYTQGILHLTSEWDGVARADWFRDVKGTRTGIDTGYFAITLGANWHPSAYLEIRPEVRGDFAGEPAFGAGGPHERNQFTAVMSGLIKF